MLVLEYSVGFGLCFKARFEDTNGTQLEYKINHFTGCQSMAGQALVTMVILGMVLIELTELTSLHLFKNFNVSERFIKCLWTRRLGMQPAFIRPIASW